MADIGRRAALIVLDGVGIGAALDAAAYGDLGSDTLGNIARAVGGLQLPNLEAAGLGCIRPLPGMPARSIYTPVGQGDSYFSNATYEAVELAYGVEIAGEPRPLVRHLRVDDHVGSGAGNARRESEGDETRQHQYERTLAVVEVEGPGEGGGQDADGRVCGVQRHGCP